MNFDALGWIRLANAALGLVSVCLVIAMASAHWAEYTARARDITRSYVTLLIAAVYGSVNGYLEQRTVTPGTLLITIGCVFALRAWHRDDEMFKK